MPNKRLVAAIALAMALPVVSTGASADHNGRYRGERKYERKYEVRKRRAQDNSYAARAHDLDPAGDYKGYPDWARVALSPKYGRGFR